MKRSLTLSVTLLLSIVLAACGAAGGGGRSGPRASSNTGSSAIPPLLYLNSDYDNDDYQPHGDDADNDDLVKPRDRDNDIDNSSGSYFDGDDRIVRAFGHAASATDRQAITAFVKRYYRVAAALDGAKGCAMQSASISKSLPEVLGRRPGPPYLSGKTCAEVLTKVFRQNYRQIVVYAANLQVSSVRLGGQEGYAILAFKGLPGRALRLFREHGVWKIGALLDGELP